MRNPAAPQQIVAGGVAFRQSALYMFL